MILKSTASPISVSLPSTSSPPSSNPPTTQTVGQASTVGLTREQLWDLRSPLINSDNSVEIYFGQQLTKLYLLIDQPNIGNREFTFHVQRLQNELSLAYQNGDLPKKGYEVATQNLSEQNKLFSDVFSQNVEHDAISFTETIDAFGDAIDDSDLEKVRSILLNANNDQRQEILSSKQAIFGLEGAMCNCNSEMIRTVIMAHIKSDTLELIFNTLFALEARLDFITALYLRITLPKESPNSWLDDVHNKLTVLTKKITPKQLTKLQEIYGNLTNFVNIEDKHKIILDFIKNHQSNPNFKFVFFNKNSLDQEGPRLITTNGKPFSLII